MFIPRMWTESPNLIIDLFSKSACKLAPSLSWRHLKWPIKMRNLKTLSLFVFFFTLARELGIFIKMDSTESRFVIGTENILFKGASVHLSARKFYKLRQWRGWCFTERTTPQKGFWKKEANSLCTDDNNVSWPWWLEDQDVAVTAEERQIAGRAVRAVQQRREVTLTAASGWGRRKLHGCGTK